MAAEENTGSEVGERGAATSGCIILGAILTVFGGLIILYIVVFFLQRNAFSSFTESEPAKIAVPQPSEAQVESTMGKLAGIDLATKEERIERFLLTKEDLNTLIAECEVLSDCRGTTLVKTISDRGIETQMTRPIRKMPLSNEQWHLNAKFIFWPELRRRTIAMRVVDIFPDKGTMPKGFVESYDSMSPLKLDPDSPYIKPYVSKIRRIYIEPPHVVVETGTPADEQPTFTREKKDAGK